MQHKYQLIDQTHSDNKSYRRIELDALHNPVSEIIAIIEAHE